MMKWLPLALSLLAAPMAAAEPLIPGQNDVEIPDDWRPRAEAVALANLAQGAKASDALTAPLAICFDTACTQIAPAMVDRDSAAAIRGLFAPDAATPAEERSLIARSIAYLEAVVGVQTGTWQDRAGNTHGDGNQDGQLDCISEATNTKSYLERLILAGLLRHHDVSGMVTRFSVVLQHVAIEIVERVSGEAWVVDSWPTANGEEPEIEPYLAWRMGWGARAALPHWAGRAGKGGDFTLSPPVIPAISTRLVDRGVDRPPPPFPRAIARPYFPEASHGQTQTDL